jgi:chemotaxis protein methyltransferase CheR
MQEKSTSDIEVDLFLEAIYQKFHYDFRDYARASIKRRLKQACIHFRCNSVSMLQSRLLHEPSMLPQMLAYLTVQVSEMFRDPDAFLSLRRNVIPHLRTYPSIKVWVAGCSAGEELYSMAILFREEGLEDRTIFYATDINTDALKKAEAGIFEMERIPLFTENHRKAGGTCSLSEYYTAAYGGALFDKTLRRNVVFSDHSLVTDAVFAEMQLVSCRNVLIYFDRDLQDHVVGLFKDSLANKGFLMLGSKENIRFSRHAPAFSEFDRKEKIYQKRGPHDGF